MSRQSQSLASPDDVDPPADVVLRLTASFHHGWSDYGKMGDFMKALQTHVLDRSPEQGSYPVM